jgi:hypothetical protein
MKRYAGPIVLLVVCLGIVGLSNAPSIGEFKWPDWFRIPSVVPKLDSAFFILIEDGPQRSADFAIVHASKQWLGLAERGIKTRDYLKSHPDAAPFVAMLETTTKLPAIVILDGGGKKVRVVPAPMTPEALDTLAKDTTGK